MMKIIEKLKGDLESGEGEVKLSRQFQSLDALMRADILKDWIFDLNVEYEKAVKQFIESLEKASNDRNANPIGRKTVIRWPDNPPRPRR